MKKGSVGIVFCMVLFLLPAGILMAAGDTEQTAAMPKEEKVELGTAFMTNVPEIIQEMCDKFSQKHPNISIDVNFIPSGKVNEFLTPKAAADMMPDMFSINGDPFGADLADRGFIADLSGTEIADRVIDGLRPQYTSPGGKFYGVSEGVASSCIYYQKAVFDNLGLVAPENWEALLDVCERIKGSNTIAPFILTAGDHQIGNTFWSYGFAQNIVSKEPKYITKLREGTMDLNTPSMADVFSKPKTLMDKGYVQEGALSTDKMIGNNLYIQGKGAMHFAGTWFGAILLETDFETKIFLPPWNNRGEKKVPVVGAETGYGISEGPRKEQALMLLDWFTGEGYPMLQNPQGKIPSIKPDEIQGKVELHPEMSSFAEQIASYKVTGGLYFEFLPPAVRPIVTPLTQEVLLGKKTPTEAAAEFDRECKKAVEN
jgi:multiple sugar transport system substrate-binding protein/raffinose/stachyose/melibiose transport system substrate-binding protein